MKGSARTIACLPLLAAISAAQTVRIDLGPPGSPLSGGFERLHATDRYSPERGHGWLSSSQTDFDVRRPPENPAWKGPGSQQIPEDYVVYKEHTDLTRDGVRSTGDLVFRADLPDGEYMVKLVFGRLDRAVCSMQVSFDELVVARDVAARHFVRRGVPDFLYGFPRTVRRRARVKGGSLTIRIHGDDGTFQQRFREEFDQPPPVSYLGGVPTRNRKPPTPDLGDWGKIDPRRGTPGGGVWVYSDIGCPFTENALSSLEIAPHEAPPIVWRGGRLESDLAAEAVEHFNADRHAEAEAAFRALEDNYARALGLLWLAGDSDFEQERRLLPEAIKLLPEGSYEIEQARRLENALQRFDHAAELQRTYNELLLISGEVDSFELGEPLYPKGKLYAGRGLFMIDPHRWAFASHAGKQILERLRAEGFKSRFIDWYLDEKWSDEYSDWSFRDYSSQRQQAPEWAAEVFEAFNRELDLAEWWITNRQREDGALGGGWGDDVEILRGFGMFVAASPDASPLVAEGNRKLANGAWHSGSVDAEAGYFAEVDDTEHSGEWTADTLTAMIQSDYGNPVYIERALKTAKLMRDLWMSVNPDGWFLMRSNFLGATGVGDGARANDSRINYRPAAPALAVFRYNQLPAIEDLFVRWADGWLAASLSTARGKPRGVIPQEIGFADSKLGGVDSPSWHTASHLPGTVNYDWGEAVRITALRSTSC